MSVVVNSWTDTLFLGYFFSAAVVAGYNSVLMISRSVPMVIGSSLSAIQQPVLSYLFGRKSELFKNVAQNTVKWNFYLSLPVLSFILIFPAQIMDVVFPQYKDAYYLIYILAPSFFIVLLSAPFKYALMAIGRTDIALKISLFMIVVNLLLNATLIPGFGMTGAAFATGFSFLINEALFMYYGKKLAGVWLHPEMRKAILSMALTSILVQALRGILPTDLLGLILYGVILVSAYTALLVVFKSFNETDKEVFDSVLGKLNLKVS
jgi:O-antigen/teichoic acid export membrane protein